MNPKAIYYALSRMFLPTLSVIILSLMWSLSPTKTFSFLLSDNTWAGVIRIGLMIAEMAWFYYLYNSFITEEVLLNKLNENPTTQKNLDYSEISNKIYYTPNQDPRAKYSLEHLPKNNAFLIRY